MPPETGKIAFRALTAADFPLLGEWLRAPHVARWWGDGEGEIAHIKEHMREDSTVRPFVIVADGRPIGYLQSYDIHAEADHPYRDQPAGSIGIDLSIGEADCIGRGLGPLVIDAFVRRLFAEGAPRVVIDPHPSNAAAIRAYEKAGFTAIGERVSAEYGPALLMARDRGATTAEVAAGAR
jgi:aminoglycoside 6'-N-acetyltransferase